MKHMTARDFQHWRGAKRVDITNRAKFAAERIAVVDDAVQAGRVLALATNATTCVTARQRLTHRQTDRQT